MGFERVLLCFETSATSENRGDSETRSLVTLQSLRQQLADDKQRGDAARAELLDELEGLRSQRQRQSEEFDASQLEIDELRHSTSETMASVEARVEADALERRQLEMATAEEFRQQQLELDAWRAALRATQQSRDAAAAEEAEAVAAQRLGEEQLQGTRQRVEVLQLEIQQLQQQQGLGPMEEMEVEEVRDELRWKAEAMAEHRQATVWMEKERQQRAARSLEQLRMAVRGLHEAEAHRSGGWGGKENWERLRGWGLWWDMKWY